MKLKNWFYKNKKRIIPIILVVFVILSFTTIISKRRVRIDREYTDKYDVALYIKTYNQLPKNYITKYGYDYYNNHNIDTDGLIIGGDTHYNDSELKAYNITSDYSLKECDIADSEYSLNYRGSHRLVYTTNTNRVRVFETPDHYDTYKEIKNFNIMPFHYVMLIITITYSVSIIALLFFVFLKPTKVKDDNSVIKTYNEMN